MMKRAIFIVWLGFGAVAAGQSDSLDLTRVQRLDVYAEACWGSNALNKFVLAGAAFGGDITSPVRSLTSLTHDKGVGFAGGWMRSGIHAVLPAMELVDPPQMGRWQTVVGLETSQWAAAEWSPAAATLAFGPHGIGRGGSLAETGYLWMSATMLRIGGIRTTSRSVRGIPMNWTLEWGVRMGELHRSLAARIGRNSEYSWDDETAAASIEAHQIQNLTSGSAVALDVAMQWAEADGGHGRPDTWSVALRNWGRGGRWQMESAQWDTSFSTPGWALISGAAPDFSGAAERDTLLGGFNRRLPSTVTFRWERRPIRTPGVVWSLTAEKLSIAPRWEWSLMRRTGRGAIQTEVGLAYGGFGGAFIPLNLNLPSRAVRQHRAGGTLAIRTRWLALAGTGGRMGLGLHWHRTF